MKTCHAQPVWPSPSSCEFLRLDLSSHAFHWGSHRSGWSPVLLLEAQGPGHGPGGQSPGQRSLALGRCHGLRLCGHGLFLAQRQSLATRPGGVTFLVDPGPPEQGC